jgi:hypothetical protein
LSVDARRAPGTRNGAWRRRFSRICGASQVANPNTPYGLRPYSYMSGAPWGGAVSVYYVPVGNATALFIGDPVLNITNSSDGNGIQTVEIASAGASDYVLGAFLGVANNAGQSVITLLQSQPVYLPASTAAYVYVSDDPFLLYAIQEDSVSSNLVSGASGRNTTLTSGTGSTVTGMSGWQLTSANLETTNTGQMRIIRGLQEIDNTIPGASAKWLCKINLHPFLNTTGI